VKIFLNTQKKKEPTLLEFVSSIWGNFATQEEQDISYKEGRFYKR